MKRTASIVKKDDNKKKKPVMDESVLYLSALLVSVGFFALLIFSDATGTGYAIETSALATKTTPHVKTRFEREVGKMVEGSPIEAMVPYIAKQDPKTATFLVSIAKHESNWGKYSPKDSAGRTCYNYWGFRGGGDNVTESGYSCFGSPKEAVAVVGSRLDYLVHGLALDTPRELIVWKCGASCAGQSPVDVHQWIDNVGIYSQKVERVAGVDEGR